MKLNHKELAKQYQESFLETLKKMVSFKSYLNENEEGTLFGVEVKKELEWVLNFCKTELKMKTFMSPKAHYGYAEIGQGPMLAILGHLDVVPPGEIDEWKTNPFELVIKNNHVYGRGVIDDKGPIVVNLYAIKALLDQGFEFNNFRLRFIFGTDEEVLWRCINEYLKHEEKPKLAYSPDADFPLIHAEKGLWQFKLIDNIKYSIEVDGPINAVPSKALYFGDKQDELSKILDELKFPYKKTPKGIEVIGKQIHSAFSDKGINPITRLAIGLDKIGEKGNLITFLSQFVGEDPTLKKVMPELEDEVTGRITFNIGTINGANGFLKADVRMPVKLGDNLVKNKLIEQFKKYNLKFEEIDYLHSLYIPKDSILVETLMDVYKKVTKNENAKPLLTGGATYARAFENCVAFGMMFEGVENLEHSPNEAVKIENYFRSMEIYIEAIISLGKKIQAMV